MEWFWSYTSDLSHAVKIQHTILKYQLVHVYDSSEVVVKHTITQTYSQYLQEESLSFMITKK
jgi:hypothetical protein